MKIIGISGKKGAGKDTIADILLCHYPKSIKYSFAAQLKIEVSHATGYGVEYIELHKDNFRLILQGWGTDFRRKLFGVDYWIKKMEDARERLSINHDVLIVPDVRFINEYEWVKRNGGIVIRVERNHDYGDVHASEVELDNATFDHTILNIGSFMDLQQKVMEIV